MIDVNLGNLHLEVVGKEPDGFPHRAEAGTPRGLKQRGGSRRPWGEQRRKSEAVIAMAITKAVIKKKNVQHRSGRRVEPREQGDTDL